jgi:hypothetical protein
MKEFGPKTIEGVGSSSYELTEVLWSQMSSVNGQGRNV